MTQALHLALGIGGGIAAAWLHLRMVRRASRRIAESRRALEAFVTLPVRVGVPVVFLVVMARFGAFSFVAAIATFVATQQISVRRIRREDTP